MIPLLHMKNKINRLSTIKEVLEEKLIGSQEELLEVLKRKGYKLTQATLSRDLRQLKVSKVPNAERGYVYKPIQASETDKSKLPAGSMFSDYFKTLEFSNTIGVIKTYSGYANSIAITIDSQNLFEIIGTIAGDDTIIIILKEGVTHKQVKQALLNKFSELKEKL